MEELSMYSTVLSGDFYLKKILQLSPPSLRGSKSVFFWQPCFSKEDVHVKQVLMFLSVRSDDGDGDNALRH
jgi:hypothetical protein